MPSFLGFYKNAARDREKKIHRAIASVLLQTHEDWELIVISDGCEKTFAILEPYVYEYLPKIRLLQVPKQRNWSGSVRNAGIFKADGEIICYLDIDDYFGENHLQLLNDNFGDNDWVFFNDWNYDLAKNDWYENKVSIEVGKCGTSNIAHRKSMNAYWRSNNYQHDWVMIRTLQGSSDKYKHIDRCEYMVCHIPNRYDI